MNALRVDPIVGSSQDQEPAKYVPPSTKPGTFQVRQMCGWLGVSRSGYHEWVKRPVSATARWRADLGDVIEALHDANDGTYGYRRMHAALARSGRRCHPDTVRSVMRERGVAGCQPRSKRRCTTRQAAQVADIPDLVGRDFTSDTAGAKLVGDITYVPTAEGWLYVALVIDCFSRAIIGWAMDDNYKTPLITAAIRMAARRVPLPPNAVFHSDRGSNYTSDEYATVLDRLGLSRSVGRTGICYDNALAESTNGALKVELVNRRHYPTREIARKDIARWIELFYNQRRLHSTLGYKTPNEVLYGDHSSPIAA
ncbi:MAG: IS3 family transposase [Nigerium sp.]|nr:IS3 family transposase [Nigerium sp.]